MFYNLWRSGALKEFDNYGLVVEKGQPVLLVRLEKSSMLRIFSKVSSNFKHPALFQPCKTGRWDDTNIIDDAEFEWLEREVEVVAEALGAVDDGRGTAVLYGRTNTLYAVSCSMTDVEERLIVYSQPQPPCHLISNSLL